jgi:hypothetical protein
MLEIVSYSVLKDLACLAWRFVRHAPTEPATKPDAPYLRSLPLSQARRGFYVPPGWAGAIVDRDACQATLRAGYHRPFQLQSRERKHRLSPDAVVLVWSRGVVPIGCTFDRVFSSDQHEFEITLRLRARVRMPVPTNADASENDRTSAGIDPDIVRAARPVIEAEVAAGAGEAVYRDAAFRDRLRGALTAPLSEALGSQGLELVALDSLTLGNSFLETVFGRRAGLAQDKANIELAVEQSRLRGALRQARLGEHLAEVQAREAFDEQLRVLAQERLLSGNARDREIAHAELEDIEARLEMWHRREEALHATFQAVLKRRADALRSARELAEEFQFQAAQGGALQGLLPSERALLARAIEESAAQQASPEEILSALRRGLELPSTVFDPLRPMRGHRTLHVGDGWRLWDGERLWQVRLHGIQTRHHGFLWRKESPSQALFEVKGSPGQHLLKQPVALDGHGTIQVGEHHALVECLTGTPSELTLEIGRNRAAGAQAPGPSA